MSREFNFALIGAAGFVAPRHIEAIHATGNELVAALDPHDSVGILDRYFPRCEFFTEFERFDRHLEKLRRQSNCVDYVSICSPNYLHDAHCRLALRVGAHAICEKPLVLNHWNLDQLLEIENESDKKIYNVLQLRLYPELIELKKELIDDSHIVDIKYITPRGKWYHTSWKGNVEKSGGLITNIGIHLFDMVLWLFGGLQDLEILVNKNDKVSGTLVLEKARVTFLLSTDFEDLPSGLLSTDFENLPSGKSSYRSIIIDDKPLIFDKLFTDLHTKVYEDILNGGGFGIEDARPSIELVGKLRREQNVCT